jgi:succinoglycan biosynthesis protein ExoA
MGGKKLLADDVRSRYFSRGSLSKLWMQFFQYGFWKVRVLQKHLRQMSIRQFIPPLFVAGLLSGLFLTLLTTWGWIVFVLVCSSYTLANLIASFVTAFQKGWKHLFLLPITFSIVHVSYGLGFLIGLIKFWNRWGDTIGIVPSI